MKTKTKCGLVMLLATVAWLLWPEKPASVRGTATVIEDSERQAKITKNQFNRRAHEHVEGSADSRDGKPRGAYEHLFDKASGANRFLFAKGHDRKYLPHSDAPSGMDLWYQDESGTDRLIHDSVTRAKFSPDGSKVAFTTSDCVLHVQDLNGGPAREVAGVYGPSWSADGNAVVFSKVAEGHNPHRPGPRQLAAIELATGKIETFTQGGFDDGRPEFGPANEWIVFVSGARSGLASFWKVPVGGGEPVQLTNVGLEQVNDTFVPTPYDKTVWSADRRWFLYDVKKGDQQETWGMEFNDDGTLKKALRLADGLNPRWEQNGRSFVCEKTIDGNVQTIVANLP